MSKIAGMTLTELRKIAADLDISGRTKLRKAELVEAIEAARASRAEPAKPTAVAKPIAAARPTAAAKHTGAAAKPTADAKSTRAARPTGAATPKAAAKPTLAAAKPAAGAQVAAAAPENADPHTAVEASPLPKRHPFEDAPPVLELLELGGIPIGYDRDHLELKVQGPDALFCYWSMHTHDPSVMDGGRAQIRLFDVTGGGHGLVRTESVEPTAGRWFIHDLAPDRDYMVEFGAARDSGFHVRLTSRVATTPPLTPSRIEDVALVTLTFRSDDLDRPAPAEVPRIAFQAPPRASDLRTVAGLRPFVPSPGDGASEWDHGDAVRTATGAPVVAIASPESGHAQADSSWGSHTLGA